MDKQTFYPLFPIFPKFSSLIVAIYNNAIQEVSVNSWGLGENEHFAICTSVLSNRQTVANIVCWAGVFRSKEWWIRLINFKQVNCFNWLMDKKPKSDSFWFHRQAVRFDYQSIETSSFNPAVINDEHCDQSWNVMCSSAQFGKRQAAHRFKGNRRTCRILHHFAVLLAILAISSESLTRLQTIQFFVHSHEMLCSNETYISEGLRTTKRFTRQFGSARITGTKTQFQSQSFTASMYCSPKPQLVRCVILVLSRGWY